MDHSGTTIYAKSLVDAFSADMVTNLYGNPHSASTPAKLSGQVVDDTREQALRFFGADPEHFDLIFLSNATAAIKLVMESFKDLGSQEGGAGFWYGYHVDSHNSLIGVRECSDQNHHLFETDADVSAWLAGAASPIPAGPDAILNPTGKLGLFAYPGQSNMTGRRLPLCWPAQLRASPHAQHTDTYSLLDAAALATTSPLHHVFADPDAAPDFTALSFYKIFGFPDLGGLIVRKASGRILSCRRYFGGGTVALVTVQGERPWFETREVLHESLEDGTLPFHSIIALKAAMETHERLYSGSGSGSGTGATGAPGACMRVISKHTTFLSKRLYDGLRELKHANGAPVVRIYTGGSGESTYGDATTQGATVSFNVLRADGSYVPYTSAVERAANKKNIYVRSGQLCNPGGIGMHLGLEKWHIQRLWAYGHRCGGHENSRTEVFHGKVTGVVRASMGAMTTKANVDAFVAFLKEEFLNTMPLLERPLTLEEGIALVIRENDMESFSDISEEKVEVSEMRSEEDTAVEQSRSDMPSEAIRQVKWSLKDPLEESRNPSREQQQRQQQQRQQRQRQQHQQEEDEEEEEQQQQPPQKLPHMASQMQVQSRGDTRSEGEGPVKPSPEQSLEQSLEQSEEQALKLAVERSLEPSQGMSHSQSQREVRSYEMVPRPSYTMTRPYISPASPISPAGEERRKQKVHVISVEEFEMSRAKIVIRPSSGNPGAPREGSLKKLLSTRGRSKKGPNAMEYI